MYIPKSNIPLHVHSCPVFTLKLVLISLFTKSPSLMPPPLRVGVGPSSPAAFSGYLCVTDPTCNGTLRLIWEANLIEKPSDVLSVQRDDAATGGDRRGRRSDGTEQPGDDQERERRVVRVFEYRS